jgi:DNA-binding winged helix-turn-helix (wHTH) protein/TolB-like protein/Tfp pilus assembly protein PilF
MTQPIPHFYEFGPFRLDVTQQLLLREGEIVALRPKDFDLLLILVRHNGRVVSKDELLQKLWPDSYVEEANLSHHIFTLRRALGEAEVGEKSEERPVYIETLPRRGYRFVINVREVGVESEEFEPGIPAADETKVTPRDLLGRLGSSRMLIGAALAVMLATTCVIYILRISVRTTEIRSLAVLPFKSLDSKEGDETLGLKLADALSLRLGRLRQLAVRPVSAMRRYEGRTLDPLVVGREQQVDAVLDGGIQRDGEWLRVTAQLLRTSDGRQIWDGVFDVRSADPFALQDSLAEQASRALAPRLGGAERIQFARRETENADAHRLYIDGRFLWNKRTLQDMRQSLDYFERSIKLDPNYARAYAGLADAYITLSDYDGLPAREAYPRAKENAQRALAIDETLAEAYATLAMISASYDWDWEGAERAFERAIKLNPYYPTAHQWYAEYLAAMGRHERSLAEIRQAESLDPLSPIIQSVEAWILYYARDYPQMIAQCKRVIGKEPNFGEIYAYLSRAYEQQGMFRDAMDAYQKRSTLIGDNTPAAMAIRAAPVLGAEDYWRKLVELEKVRSTGSAFNAAEALAQLGETDRAIDLLEQSYTERSYHMMYLKVHPNLDRLRGEERFKKLLRRIHPQ